jgi:hypothetical protein
MVEEAARGCRVPVTRVGSLDSLGVRFGEGYWMGLAFEEPGCLRFQTEGKCIDPAAAANLEIGCVVANPQAPGGLSWRRVAELGSEQIDFYSRSTAHQMEWVEAFLRECLSQARSIETGDQPPTTEEPKGA